jgi:asparagine synthase (glutamine-hydrolysing)
MVARQAHRGPDAYGIFMDNTLRVGLGHRRLSIIDLSPAGTQPMHGPGEQTRIVFNGEIYNYLELRQELSTFPYKSRTDTEVVLAAYEAWGDDCLHRLNGMFAFVIWDERKRRIFAARDRFGVKPLYYYYAPNGTLMLASEIKALHAAGVPATPDLNSWATYLASGLHDHSDRTFWEDIRALRPGQALAWTDGTLRVYQWYDLAAQAGLDFDQRPTKLVAEEYTSLLEASVRLRFRSDVPVGINLSGGLDSSVLLGLVQRIQGADSEVKAFTYITGDPAYDELPWTRRMLARTRHPSVVCELKPELVPELARSVQESEDEPFGGLPTLAYSLLFDAARADGVIVLLDGQGMDEQWCGYDYYAAALAGGEAQLVQATVDRPVRPHCLTPEFRRLAAPFETPKPFRDVTRDLQYRDACFTKIPKALRFNDRISMRSSTELREPFLDHRLMELAFRQPTAHKIARGANKWLLREIARGLLPQDLVEAPKRPIQTPQREWLRGPLRQWAEICLQNALRHVGGSWFRSGGVRLAWRDFCQGKSDNSFFVWQWISAGLFFELMKQRNQSCPKLRSEWNDYPRSIASVPARHHTGRFVMHSRTH